MVQNGYNTERLAGIIRRSKSYVDKIMAGHGSFTVDEANKILQAMGIHRSWMPFVFDKHNIDFDVTYMTLLQPLRKFAEVDL